MDGSNGSNCLPESPKEEMDTKQTIDDHNPRSEGTLVTAEEFDITIRVLKTLSKPENNKIYDSQPFRPLRQALQPFFNAQKSQMFSGLTPAEHSAKQFNKRRMAQDRYNKILEDEKNLKRTMLRAGRLKRLEEIVTSQDKLVDSNYMILDGVAEDGGFNQTTLPGELAQVGNVKSGFVIGNSECETDPNTAASNEESAGGNKEAPLDSSSVLQNNPNPNVKIPLLILKACYICKCQYGILHHFYDSLCPTCAALNWTKRIQMCDLKGRICLVTGGRVKIGFQCCLKLLRCGSVVISTTRFPVDAAKRFAAQTDFSEWSSRLHIYGVDLRDLVHLESFCETISRTFPKIDAIINNACQTIRRPVAYYAHMIEHERTVLEQIEHIRGCRNENGTEEDVAVDGNMLNASAVQLLDRYVDHWNKYKQKQANNSLKEISNGAQPGGPKDNKLSAIADADDQKRTAALHAKPNSVPKDEDLMEIVEIDSSGVLKSVSTTVTVVDSNPVKVDGGDGIGVHECTNNNTTNTANLETNVNMSVAPISSAELSQIPVLLPDDQTGLLNSAITSGQADCNQVLFPTDCKDVNHQQLDLRTQNSWNLKAHEVGTPEVAEVMAINSIAPFVLIAKLKHLMIPKSRDGTSTDSNRKANRNANKKYEVSFIGTMNGCDGGGALRSTLHDGPVSCEPASNKPRKPKHANNKPNKQNDHESKNAKDYSNMVHSDACSFVVNVSSMEGKFYRRKLDTHPHTNMAKAALNMMTRTCAQDYRKDDIYMTAVDTGWINDENPIEKANRIAVEHRFVTPLDEVDAAARILDPMFTPLIDAKSDPNSMCSPPYGCFLKDYALSEW